MDRRIFMKGVAAAGLAAQAMRSAGAPKAELERRPLGNTGEKLSIIGFAGLMLNRKTQEDANNWIAEAFDRGVNYYDVAPAYGNSQDLMGPALKPYRDKCFLACKSKARDGAGIRQEMENSLKLLQTDHFELYQLHCLFTPEEVQKAAGPGGAIEEILKMKQEGKLKYIGFSAHTEAGAHAALDAFAFDTILFPLNFACWHKGNFGPSVYEHARKKNVNVLAMKAQIYQGWTKDAPQRPTHPYRQMWYEPLVDPEKIALAIRFTLGLPVVASVTPGNFELFKLGLDAAQKGTAPLSEAELETLKKMAEVSTPLFPQVNEKQNMEQANKRLLGA